MKIAITGKMCSGKSSLANILLESDSRFKNLFIWSKSQRCS